MPEGEWATWALMAGRGFGKNRTGAEAIREIEAAGLKVDRWEGSSYLDIDVMTRHLPDDSDY